MTTNQQLAADLADDLARGRTDAGDLTDEQWYLLLLSAGLNCPAANPAVVARRVLRRRATQTGYFADTDTSAGPTGPSSSTYAA